MLTESLFAQEFVALEGVGLDDVDPVDSSPYGLAFHLPTTRGYVTLSGDPGFPAEDSNGSTVVEFDMASFEVVREFTVDLFPTDLVVGPDGDFLYVVCSTTGTLNVVDLDSEEIESYELLDNEGLAVSFPSGISLSPDETELWITSNGSSFDGSNENLVILDRSTLDLIDTVEIIGGLGRIAVSSDGIVVVPVGYPGDVFPSEPEVRIYDASRGAPWTELDTLTLEMETLDFPAPSDVVIDADGSLAYVSVFGGSSEIFVIDLDSLTVETIEDEDGSTAHQGLVLSEDGEYLLVTSFFDNELLVFDIGTDPPLAIDPLETGPLPNSVRSAGGRAWSTDQGGDSVSVFTMPGSFLRGDATGNGSFDLADPIALLVAIFLDGALACDDLGDANDDGELTLLDALLMLDHLFQGGEPVAYPYPDPGADLVDDGFDDCE